MHIPHPYELVEFQKELISFFDGLPEYINSNLNKVTLKWDGMNIAFKIMDNKVCLLNKNGGILNFFDHKNENIRDHYQQVWSALNKIYKSNPGPFLRLGLDEPDIFCNCEFIPIKTNVITYNQNIFVFHSVNKKIDSKKNVIIIPGAQLQETLVLAQKTFEGISTLATLPVHPLALKSFNTLGQNLTFPGIFEGHQDGTVSKGSKEWSRKKVYLDLILNDQIPENADGSFWETMKTIYLNQSFGQQLLDSTEWPETFSTHQEGLVVSGYQKFPDFKIVGDFYLDTFKTNKFDTYFIVIAGMKPPHKGHVHLLKETVRKAKQYNSKVNLFISQKDRDDITIKESKQILELYVTNENLNDHLEICYSNDFQKDVYKFVLGLPSNSSVYVAHSKSETDKFEKLKIFLDSIRHDVSICSFPVKPIEYNGTKLSSTELRKAVKNSNYGEFLKYIPENSQKDTQVVWNVLKQQSQSKAKCPMFFIG